MKKIVITAVIISGLCILSSCGKKVDIDELISARELPDYSEGLIPGGSVGGDEGQAQNEEIPSIGENPQNEPVNQPDNLPDGQVGDGGIDITIDDNQGTASDSNDIVIE